ncbi:putative NADH-ubiquinone oxidoreductase 21 kDa subunit [Lineolata rhizophorae]|uniref:Putative NADH-ubiquinone oxidoreductase 21 kDa subunit n=1 Tax=Lineolata rhizophorae TaxID=578093 RepID=A0A6A6P3C7_9PEZI|nr:putative NADH-ubiquinone oxidoreductase 21 kDa subunit [Lineolata rhizophorae]
MTEQRPLQQVPPHASRGEYPLIDSDPHIKRVFTYARKSDYVAGAGMASLAPTLLYVSERISPSRVPRGGFAPIMRLTCAIGFSAGFFTVYSLSSQRFYGMRENTREVDMDMKEMVAKVKNGEPLYGTSSMSEYMQGMAARNSRYSAVFAHILPWFNFVNHNQHGVDTAKYYQQAERELAAEGAGKREG